MKKISSDELFIKYPIYENINELKIAEILIMPLYVDGAFSSVQKNIFRGVSSDYKVKCLYYSERQDILRSKVFFAAAVTPDLIINLGLLIIGSIDLLDRLYEILKDKISEKKFKAKIAVKMGNHYYEMEEFEGTPEQYRFFIQERWFKEKEK